jgi:periplasmic protein TonB
MLPGRGKEPHIPGMRVISQSPLRLFCALLLSLALHGGLLYFGGIALRPPSPPPMNLLHARLEPPAEIPVEIIKNTLKEEAPEAIAPPPAGRGPVQPEKLAGRRLERLMERLSETLAYPPEALEQGLEGEVVLILSQDAQGGLARIAVASGSGHAVLDEAAVRAVRDLRSLGPEFDGKTWLFPVTFELN